eukprot:2861890-Pleurochrysis_carterae.AAC.1
MMGEEEGEAADDVEERAKGGGTSSTAKPLRASGRARKAAVAETDKAPANDSERRAGKRPASAIN